MPGIFACTCARLCSCAHLRSSAGPPSEPRPLGSVRSALLLCAAFLLTLTLTAAPQDTYDREAYARDHVHFLVLQLDQWSKEFPQQFYAALMKPPVGSTK